MTKDIKQKAIKLYQDGMSSREVKEELNLDITVRSIQRMLKKEGIIRSTGDAFRLAVKKGVVSWDHLKKPEDRKTKKRRVKLSDKKRFEILSRDNYRCVYCGYGPKDGVKLQIDHIVSLESNGTNDMDNLQTTCMSCNYGKYHATK